jgi:hypothetical protein
MTGQVGYVFPRRAAQEQVVCGVYPKGQALPYIEQVGCRCFIASFAFMSNIFACAASKNWLSMLPMNRHTLERWKKEFVELLPRIDQHASVYFRDFRKNPEKFEDALQEARGIAWVSFLTLKRKGRKPESFISRIADFAVKHTRFGRKLTGAESAKDAMSPRAQRDKGFFVQSLPRLDTAGGENEALDGLQDNTQTPPDEQAAFRIDYPAWLKQYSQRDRAITIDMSHGERTQDLAKKYKLSQGRLSQMRGERHEDWEAFHSEPERGI